MSNVNIRKLLLADLFTAVFIGVVAGVNHSPNPNIDNHVQSFLKAICGSTLYPHLCYSTIATEAKGLNLQKVPSRGDVIELALNTTIRAVHQNNLTVAKLLTGSKGVTQRAIIALHDCLETIDETLDELQKAMLELRKYPHADADLLKTLLSAAITNQVTCPDGFFHSETEADRRVEQALAPGHLLVQHMCSNALAMTIKMTTTTANNYKRKLVTVTNDKQNHNKWPEWLLAADRRLLLQKTTAKGDVVVAADGSGDFTTVSAAVAAAPERSKKRFIIRIKGGVYRENVVVPRNKMNIMLLGEGANTTIITGSRNYVDGSTTFHSATVAAVGDRFLARDITFQNTAGASKHQAVALRVGADLSAFYRCNFIAYQDTLYVYSNRQFFVGCLISGTVDFIFGNAAAVFQDCDIQARRPNSGQRNMLTAQGRVDPNQNTGIVFQKCRIGATQDLEPVKAQFPTYLGRPWKLFSRTVIMQSTISDVIQPEGWHEWNKSSYALNTLFYAEYQNTGTGAATFGRVKWRGFRVITSTIEAQAFTPEKFISGASWLSSTGFPFYLGL